jgi:regulator of protease activity HflC (stomatin/prohibitin superfamily)
MFKYYKGEPNVHVVRYRRGEIVRDGPGLAFWYLPHNTSIAAVPIATQDALFIFNETTRDFQTVTIQGAAAYRLKAPVDAAKSLDYTIDLRKKHYKTKDPEKLPQRVINVVQTATRAHVLEMSLQDALTKVRDLAAHVLTRVQQDPLLRSLGVTVEGLHFTSVSATPEMKKALEADFREALQQKADQAVYARRGSALEEERRLKERELGTEVELENQRKALIDTQARNKVALAEADAKAEQLKLAPYGDVAPQVLVGLALKDWAGSAPQIGHLSITPDMLGQLVGYISQGGRNVASAE